MKKDSRLRKHEHPIIISDNEKIIVCYQSINGKVLKFSVSYLYLLKGEWTCIRRCDNSHDDIAPHCHFFHVQDGQMKENKIYLEGEPGKLLTDTIESFKKQRAIIVGSIQQAYDNKR